MDRRAAFAALVVGASVFGASVFAQEIHLKTRTIPANRGAAVAPPRIRAPLAATGDSVHQIVQFDHPPGLDDLDSLATDVTVVNALPDNAVMVVGKRDSVPLRGGIDWIGQMDSADKISPDLPAISDAPLAAIIEFHPDVDQATQDALLTQTALTFERPATLLPNHVLAFGTRAALSQFAAHDPVAYIFPASAEMLREPEVDSCAGMLTIAGAVAQYANIIHGWDLDSDKAAHLSYVFGSLTPKLPATTVQSEILRAMNEWSRAANVTFQAGQSASAPRTIVIKFISGAHGDAYPFDGPSGTLAHTFYPVPINPESIAGDVHLDADEKWRSGGDVDIFSVALHELGHALGLGHSDKPGDVMYPYYRRGMTLSKNDIGAVQSLYGAPSAITAPVSTPAPTPVISTLRNSADAPIATTQAGTASLTGIVTGGTGPYSAQWQSDQGYSGKATVTSSGRWTADTVTLITGLNTVTVTVFDAQRRTATAMVAITRTAPTNAPVSLTAPVSVSITSPASNVVTVNQPSLTLTGKAIGGIVVSRVTWQTAAGASGTAMGTERWTTGPIPLLLGTNNIVIRAYDSKGQSGWASLVAVRR